MLGHENCIEHENKFFLFIAYCYAKFLWHLIFYVLISKSKCDGKCNPTFEKALHYKILPWTEAVSLLRTHTQNIYMNAVRCPRLRRLGLADQSEACNVVVLDPSIIDEMQICFDHSKANDEKSIAQKVLEKAKGNIRYV